MGRPLNEFDRDLLALAERACAHARELSAQPGGLPEEEVRTLKRADGDYLEVVTVGEIDWHKLSAKLAEAPGIWDEVIETRRRAIANGNLSPADDIDEEPDAYYFLWTLLVMAVLKDYVAKKSDWEWDGELAARSMAEWISSRSNDTYRTIAPLYHFKGPNAAIEIEEGLIIRPFTDEDREAIWRGWGVENARDPFTPADLGDWSHVVDYRWRAAPGFFELDHQPGIDGVTDVVRAIRLFQPHATGTRAIWSRPDPLDNPNSAFVEMLLPVPGNSSLLHEEPWAEIDSSDREALVKLLRGIRAAGGDRRLAMALRRFDSAYERDEEEDSLIDLWIAFEALLLPDGKSELSYRAAVRIAQLVGGGADDRHEAFKLARLSYKCRSQVVHGQEVKNDLYEIVEDTRELARKALRSWVLEPPPGGIEEVDQSLFG